METIEDKYGLPITCRVPAQLKQDLVEEAKQRGMSLAGYFGTFVVNAHKVNHDKQAELNNLYKEKQALQSVLSSLQNETNWYKAEHKQVIEILLQNERILNQLYEEHQENLIERQTALDLGFKPSYATEVLHKGNQAWIGVFTIYYTNIKSKIQIKKEWKA